MTVSDEEDDDSIYDKLIETNRFRIVKYFDPYVVFDVMRSRGVFTMDDQERVQNMYPPTRRARAGQFLDILQTKGDKGVEIFIEVLEYDYPHVYKLITNKDAKEPPKTFKQHRESIRSKWIDRTGELVDVIRNQHSENHGLRDQLEDLKAVVNLNQENIQAAENDNNVLREQLRLLTSENKSCKEQNTSLLRERDRLKDDNLRIQKDCIEYFKEKDYYKDKISVVQVERDQLELKTAELNAIINEQRNNNAVAKCDVRENNLEKIHNRLEEIRRVEKDALARMEMENHILKDEVKEHQVHAEELAEHMDHLRVELDKSQGECTRLREKIDKEKRERGLIEQWLHEKNDKIKTYFGRIGELEKDKQNLEGERNKEQQKNKELDQKYSKLFNEKHQQEQEMYMLNLEITELKMKLRNSGEIPPLPDPGPAVKPPQSQGTGSSVTSSSTPDLSEYMQLKTFTELLPWKINDYAGRPISLVSGPFSRSGSYDAETRETWTVKMKMPLLDKFSICGGNFTGIYVDTIKMKKAEAPKPGDKIESMCKITVDYSQQERTFFEGFTHSQAKEKLNFKHSDDIEVTFRRRKINETLEYNCALKWMSDEKNSKRGDYFFVRANYPFTPEGSGLPKYQMNVGDIFLVLDTCPATAGEWQALKFDREHGRWATSCKAIPDTSSSRKLGMVKQPSADCLPSGRKQAFKKRNMYINVFPMEATSKLPVWMVGPQDVVIGVQNLMCRYHPSSFLSADMGNMQRMMAKAKTEEKHLLIHVNTQSRAEQLGILLYFSVQTEDKEKLSNILETKVNPDASTLSLEVLQKQGLDLAEVVIPSNDIQDKISLVETAMAKINKMQKRILWLCDRNLKKYKPEVLEEYKSFFTENNNTMLYSRLNSGSQEEASQGQESMSDTGIETSSQTSRSEPVYRSGRKESFVCNSWADEQN